MSRTLGSRTYASKKRISQRPVLPALSTTSSPANNPGRRVPSGVTDNHRIDGFTLFLYILMFVGLFGFAALVLFLIVPAV
jgi:hypothetical protein